MILGRQPDIEVVGEAADGAEAVELRRELRPDVVLMDVRMPGVDGIDATRAAHRRSTTAPRVLVLTTFDLDDVVYDALRAGASGFLLKDAPEERLVDRDPGRRRGRLAVRAVGDPAADRGVRPPRPAPPRRPSAGRR